MDARIRKAANDLRIISAYLNELIGEIREDDDVAVVYAKVYYLRQDLGRVVGSLGSGVPARSRTPVRPRNMVKP